MTELDIAVGTADGLWLFGGTRRRELPGRKIGALRPAGAELLAVLDDRSLARRDAAGSWETFADISDLRMNCILPLDGGVLAGTSRAHLLRIERREADTLRSFEDVEGRNDWFTPWGGPPDVRSLDVGGDRIYVNVHVGGILRSDRQLQSWQPTIDINSDVHEVHTVAGHPDLVLAACARGLAVSADGGDSWSYHTEGLHAEYCRAVVACKDSIVLTASLGPRGGGAALYRCPLESPEALDKCERGLPEWFADNIDTGCLAARDQFVVFGTAEGAIFTSTDAGATWTEVASDLPEVLAVAVLNLS